MSAYLPYWACAALLLVGLHGMLCRPNLLRKLMALNIVQVSVVLFYLLLGVKAGGDPPVLAAGQAAEAARFINPLPHALMLTAIVVGVSVTGVALALLLRIHRIFGTLQEPEILQKLEKT